MSGEAGEPGETQPNGARESVPVPASAAVPSQTRGVYPNVLIGTLSLTKYLIFQKIKPPKSCLFSGLFRERVSS